MRALPWRADAELVGEDVGYAMAVGANRAAGASEPLSGVKGVIASCRDLLLCPGRAAIS